MRSVVVTNKIRATLPAHERVIPNGASLDAVRFLTCYSGFKGYQDAAHQEAMRVVRAERVGRTNWSAVNGLLSAIHTMEITGQVIQATRDEIMAARLIANSQQRAGGR